jgi:hypothetical protein
MLRATMDCLEKGQAPTAANRARVVGRRRQSVWEFDKRHPDFHEWQDKVLSVASSTKWGLVKSRTADLAMQGSPTHAEIYCRMESGHYGPSGVNAERPPPGAPVVQMNFLIPRPDPALPPTVTPATAINAAPEAAVDNSMPMGTQTSRPASILPQGLNRLNIPTIVVRR